MQSIERSQSKSLALQIWQQELDNLHLHFTINWEGPGFYKTPFCQLYLRDGTKLAEGVGKGLDSSQAELSAKFEALENYLQSSTTIPPTTRHLTIAEANREYELLPFRTDISLYQNELNNPITLPWLPYRDLCGEKNYAILKATVDLQYLKKNTNEDQKLYHQYKVFASTNGLASGTSFDEAFIHAITEVIERDALSYFLLDIFLLEKPITIINKATMPPGLRQLVTDIEQQYDDELLICVMPSRMNIPVYCACFQQTQSNGSQVKGFGASLVVDYALERAIVEAVQSLHVSKFSYEKPTDINNFAIKEFPVLVKCYQFSLQTINERETVAFVSNIKDYCDTPLAEYKQELIRKVQLSGHEVIYHQVYSSLTGIHVLRVIIPGMEEFFHVTNGALVSPNSITQQYIKRYAKS